MKLNGDVPTARSGHSFTQVGPNSYLLYGGIDNSKKGSKILPNNDIYTMKIGNSKPSFLWIYFKFFIQTTAHGIKRKPLVTSCRLLGRSTLPWLPLTTIRSLFLAVTPPLKPDLTTPGSSQFKICHGRELMAASPSPQGTKSLKWVLLPPEQTVEPLSQTTRFTCSVDMVD